MKLTGERPLEGATPESILALHDAGYREVEARLRPGVVLDLGCGTGEATRRLRGPGRKVIGVDYHSPTAAAAQQISNRTAESGQPVFAAMDGARLGFRSSSIDSVCSSHLIEHFEAPERHVAEIARILADEGSAYILTPNAPMDFENPFHVYPFDAAQLSSLLRLFFDEVEIYCLVGSAELKEDFARRRSSGERLLRLDPLKLRTRMPRSWYVFSYERLLPLVYRTIGAERSGVGSSIDQSHLTLSESVDESAPVLFAVAHRPRRPVI